MKKTMHPESLMDVSRYKPELSEGPQLPIVSYFDLCVLRLPEEGKHFESSLWTQREKRSRGSRVWLQPASTIPISQILEERLCLWIKLTTARFSKSACLRLSPYFSSCLKPGDLLIYSMPYLREVPVHFIAQLSPSNRESKTSRSGNWTTLEGRNRYGKCLWTSWPIWNLIYWKLPSKSDQWSLRYSTVQSGRAIILANQMHLFHLP